MRRFVYLLLLTVFVSASVTCVNASTECERWFVAYRQELAHTRNVQRIAAARRRAKRKLANLTAKPATPVKHVQTGPHMTRTQTLHHFDLACGVLPETQADEPVVAEEIPEAFSPDLPMDSIDLLPDTPTGFIAENDLPPTPYGGGGPPDEGGGPGVYPPPVGGGPGGSPGKPGTPSTPGSPGTTSSPPPNSPPPVVPEPGSFVLLLTGMIGAAGMARRRFTI